MLVKSWEQIPFATGVNNLREDKANTELPFSISCGTQQGLEHFENSLGNQDAISLIIETDFVIGVVCDGCTSSDVQSVNEFTSNQVGANLLSKKASSVIHNFSKSHGVKSIPENLLLIQNELLSFLNNLVNSLGENDEEKELLINNFFTTTIIAFAIDKEDYCIFNFGDGIAFTNADRKELNFIPGKYLTSYLENEKLSELGLNIIEAGKTETLNSIFISSDGFDNSKVIGNKHFTDFINKKYTEEKKGFIDGLPEFRKLFLTPFIEETEIFVQWPDDDATFVLVRRITKEEVALPEVEIKPVEIVSPEISFEKFLLETFSEKSEQKKEEEPILESKESVAIEEPISENVVADKKENQVILPVNKTINKSKKRDRGSRGKKAKGKKNNAANFNKPSSNKPKNKKR